MRTIQVFFIASIYFLTASPALAADIFTVTLSRGSTDATTGGQIGLLQLHLAKDKTLYPEGLVTGYFGPATERAVQRFQSKEGVVTSGSPATTGYGMVGRLTRASLNKKYSGSKPVTPAPATPQPGATPPAPATTTITTTVSGNIFVTKNLDGTVSGSNKITLNLIGGPAVPLTITQLALPRGVTVKMTPNSCTPTCVVTNTVTVGIDAAPGNYPLAFQVSGNSVTTTTVPYTLSIGYATKFGFHFIGDKSPIIRTVTSLSSISYPFEAMLDGGTAETVTLSATAPLGISASVNPSSCTLPCGGTVTINAPSPKVGSFTIQLKGRVTRNEPTSSTATTTKSVVYTKTWSIPLQVLVQ